MPNQSMMLWRSDDAPHVLVLGSIHFLDEALPDWVPEVHEGADAVVFEADLREVTRPPAMPDGLLLPSLDHGLWQRVEETANDLGLATESVQNLRDQYPYAVAIHLAVTAFGRSGAQFEQGVEGALLERTRIPLFFENCAEFYRTLYQDTPLSEQFACLRLAMTELDELPDRFRRAAESWRRGDPEAVLEAFGFSRLYSDAPGIAAGMFTNRHSLWLPRAKYYIHKAAELGHRLLIVVGCSHLVGPQSFLADLKKHCGYDFHRSSSGWPAREVEPATREDENQSC